MGPTYTKMLFAAYLKLKSNCILYLIWQLYLVMIFLYHFPFRLLSLSFLFPLSSLAPLNLSVLLGSAIISSRSPLSFL